MCKLYRIQKRTDFIRISDTRKTSYSKVTVGARRPPSVFTAYEGTVQIRRKCSTQAAALALLNDYVQIKQLGHFQAEGMGEIQWQQP